MATVNLTELKEYFSEHSLPYRPELQADNDLTDVILLGVIIYAVLGKLSDVVVKVFERAALQWHPSYAPQRREAFA